VIAVALAAVGGAFAFGALPRLRARDTVRDETIQLAVPSVSVIHPERAAPEQEIVLPGNVVAYGDTPLFARTSGYVKQWYVDIGARVKQGQLLAVIATPEVDQQLQQARGTLAAGQANLRLAEETAQRFTELRATRAVSQQDVDTAMARCGRTRPRSGPSRRPCASSSSCKRSSRSARRSTASSRCATSTSGI